jgi:hypothetical protein
MEHLERAAMAARHLPVEVLVERVLTELGTAEDDVAVMAVRLHDGRQRR